MKKAKVIPLLLALASCDTFTEKRYRNFDAAMALPRVIQEIPVFRLGATPPTGPWLVPYARVDGSFDGRHSDKGYAWRLRQEAIARELNPDALLYSFQGEVTAGAVATYVGFGISTVTHIVRPQAGAFCCRASPIALGIRMRADHMVLEVEDHVRASGILEGDTILTIDGAAVDPPLEDVSEWALRALTKIPGDNLKVVWIRPGTGKMEGTLVAQKPTHPTIEGAMVTTVDPHPPAQQTFR
jgi:hypothetical protein